MALIAVHIHQIITSLTQDVEVELLFNPVQDNISSVQFLETNGAQLSI